MARDLRLLDLPIRRCSRLPRIAVLVALAVALPAPSFAAPPKDSREEPKKAEARRRFERGVGLFADGNYESALVEFRTSIGDYPTRTAALNIAVCLRKLGRFDEELEALQELERRYPSGSKADLSEIERAKNAVADRLGTVQVTVDVPGATVFVDGRDRGQTPLSNPLSASAGARTLRVVKTHYEPYEIRFDLPARTAKQVTVHLVPDESAPATPTPAAPVRTPTPTITRHRASLAPALALGGLGLAAAGVGTAILLGREGTIRDAKDAGCVAGPLTTAVYTRCMELQSSASRERTLGSVLVGGGAVFLVGGLAYALFRGSSEESTSQEKASISCSPGLGSLVCAGSF